MTATFKLRLYLNRTRGLMFDGMSDDPRVQLQPPKKVVLDGTEWLVVNQGSFPGELSLWLSEAS